MRRPRETLIRQSWLPGAGCNSVTRKSPALELTLDGYFTLSTPLSAGQDRGISEAGAELADVSHRLQLRRVLPHLEDGYVVFTPELQRVFVVTLAVLEAP